MGRSARRKTKINTGLEACATRMLELKWIRKNLTGLVSECIPEAGAEVVEIGAARIVFVYCVDPAQEADGEQHGFGQRRDAEAYARTRFDIVGPIFAQAIDRGVVVPEQLHLRQRVAAAILRIEQHVVLEAADEDAVLVRFEEEAVAAAVQHLTEAFGVGEAAAIIGYHGANILAVG